MQYLHPLIIDGEAKIRRSLYRIQKLSIDVKYTRLETWQIRRILDDCAEVIKFVEMVRVKYRE